MKEDEQKSFVWRKWKWFLEKCYWSAVGKQFGKHCRKAEIFHKKNINKTESLQLVTFIKIILKINCAFFCLHAVDKTVWK